MGPSFFSFFPQASVKGLAKECRQHVLEAADRYIGWLCTGCSEHSRPTGEEGPVCAMLGHLVASTRQLGLGEKLLIMVDDNLYYRSMRAAWFRLARSCECRMRLLRWEATFVPCVVKRGRGKAKGGCYSVYCQSKSVDLMQTASKEQHITSI